MVKNKGEFMTAEHYERLKPYRQLIDSYQLHKTWTVGGLDVIGQIYKEMGYHFKHGCSGCLDMMLKDIYNSLTKHEIENGKTNEQTG